MDFTVSYSEHWKQLYAELARGVFDPPPDPRRHDWTAFCDAAGTILRQLVLLEIALKQQGRSIRELREAVRQPFVLGYVVGTTMAAIERVPMNRLSSEATGVIVTVLQVVLGGGSFDECAGLVNGLLGNPGYVAGMEAAANDADVPKERALPLALAAWLEPRLGLRVGPTTSSGTSRR